MATINHYYLAILHLHSTDLPLVQVLSPEQYLQHHIPQGVGLVTYFEVLETRQPGQPLSINWSLPQLRRP